MNQTITKFAAPFLVAVVTLLGCTENKPEGPAERIGRGVDEILGGVRDLGEDSEWNNPDSRDARGSPRSNDSSRDSASATRNDQPYIPRCDPRFDPKCDDPYWAERDGSKRGR